MNLSEENPETRRRQWSCFVDGRDCVEASDLMNGVKRDVFEKMLTPNLLKASRKLRFEHRLAMMVEESDDSGRRKEDTWCCIREVAEWYRY